MTQPNGLPIDSTPDTIGTHDFSNVATWPAIADSKWVLDPIDEESPYHDKAVQLNEIQLDFAEQLVMHTGGALIIDFYMSGNPNPVRTYAYTDMDDWIARSQYKQRIDYQGPIGPFMQFNISFAQPPILWTSTGVDAEGNPKLNKMVLRIEDDSPYLDDTSEPAKIARGRYFAEVYDDPDIE